MLRIKRLLSEVASRSARETQAPAFSRCICIAMEALLSTCLAGYLYHMLYIQIGRVAQMQLETRDSFCCARRIDLLGLAPALLLRADANTGGWKGVHVAIRSGRCLAHGLTADQRPRMARDTRPLAHGHHPADAGGFRRSLRTRGADRLGAQPTQHLQRYDVGPNYLVMELVNGVECAWDCRHARKLKTWPCRWPMASPPRTPPVSPIAS
jgi:hypothetical protein